MRSRPVLTAPPGPVPLPTWRAHLVGLFVAGLVVAANAVWLGAKAAALATVLYVLCLGLALFLRRYIKRTDDGGE